MFLKLTYLRIYMEIAFSLHAAPFTILGKKANAKFFFLYFQTRKTSSIKQLSSLYYSREVLINIEACKPHLFQVPSVHLV